MFRRPPRQQMILYTLYIGLLLLLLIRL